MISSLSILLPSYNNCCTALVKALQTQAATIPYKAFRYEIIVADDGSTDARIINQNIAVNDLPHCRFICRQHNTGRAAIRNFLAQQAQYDYLLFIDSDRKLGNTDFIARYVALDGIEVACGGLTVQGNPELLCHNIRYQLETLYEQHNSAAERQQRAYSNFNTSNFLTRRDILLAIPFDERFKKYGYEDVLWGKALRQHHVDIMHINNPIVLDDFESNAAFVAKMEEGMDTLHTFQHELRGYSRLIASADKLQRYHLKHLAAGLFGCVKKSIKANLTGNKPSLFLFNIYKLGLLIAKDYQR